MSKQDVNEVTAKAIKSGGLLAKLYFDMQSEKAEDLQPLMTDMVNNSILKAPGVIYCFGSIEEPMKLDNVYSTSAVMTILFKDIGALINIIFNLAPIGIEIMKPEGQYTVPISDLNGVLVSLSHISAEYSKYILTKVMTKDDLERVKTNLKAREELGKRLLKKDDQKE